MKFLLTILILKPSFALLSFMGLLLTGAFIIFVMLVAFSIMGLCLITITFGQYAPESTEDLIISGGFLFVYLYIGSLLFGGIPFEMYKSVKKTWNEIVN